MLLRTRVSLFVILGFVAVCLILAFVALRGEELVRAQYSAGIISDQTTLWGKINDNLVQRMEDKAWIVAENSDFHSALKSKNHEDIQRLGTRIFSQLIDQEIADRFDALYDDGTLAYSSQTAVFPSSIIAANAGLDAMRSGERVRGIGNDKQRNVAAVLGVPLRTPDGTVIGLGVYATNLKEAIVEMERVTNASVLMVNRRGRMLVGTDTSESVWSGISEGLEINQINTLQTAESSDQLYSAVVLPQSANLGSLVGRLVSLRDVTELVSRQKRITQTTIIAVTVLLLAVLVALNYYMARAFAPLTEGVSVLDALSRGDLEVDLESTGARDEVGHIISAVDVFRANLIAVDRIRRSRRRQHDRQERFIRREMTQLADTLDPDERKAVLAELNLLEHEIAEEVNPGARDVMAMAVDKGGGETQQESDSLAMVAVAFQKMSSRVQDQNQRLRDALASKEAYIALQKELDIASRVQVSLLPPPMPPTATFEVTGFMRPAKEIGGDFYDFFRIDEHRIGLVIADVSGKGVPAALFMAMSRTLIRATATHTQSPGEVLVAVNDLLEQNNIEQLFVTVFYGVLDERTGRLIYANGGHNPPLLRDNEGVHALPLTGGMLLAMFAENEYDENHVDLTPGARLILLTDGVTEACNAELEEFGDDRLSAVVAAMPEKQCIADDVQAIIGAVDTFAGEALQFDDITCVVLRFKGPAKTGSTTPA